MLQTLQPTYIKHLIKTYLLCTHLHQKLSTCHTGREIERGRERGNGRNPLGQHLTSVLRDNMAS